MDQSYLADPQLDSDVVCQGTGRLLQLSAFDVPGSQSTDGKDDEYMKEILKAMSVGKANIRCIMLIIKLGQALTPALKEQIKRYWEQFPPMQGQWIVSHTFADPLGTDHHCCFEGN
jgi:hypothetical protein